MNLEKASIDVTELDEDLAPIFENTPATRKDIEDRLTAYNAKQLSTMFIADSQGDLLDSGDKILLTDGLVKSFFQMEEPSLLTNLGSLKEDFQKIMQQRAFKQMSDYTSGEELTTPDSISERINRILAEYEDVNLNVMYFEDGQQAIGGLYEGKERLFLVYLDESKIAFDAPLFG